MKDNEGLLLSPYLFVTVGLLDNAKILPETPK